MERENAHRDTAERRRSSSTDRPAGNRLMTNIALSLALIIVCGVMISRLDAGQDKKGMNDTLKVMQGRIVSNDNAVKDKSDSLLELKMPKLSDENVYPAKRSVIKSSSWLYDLDDPQNAKDNR